MQKDQPHIRFAPLIYYLIIALLFLMGLAGLFKLVSTMMHWRMLYNLTTPELLWLQINMGVIGAVSTIPALVQMIGRKTIAQKVTIITFFWYSVLYWVDQLWITADPSTRIGWLPRLGVMAIVLGILFLSVYSPNLSAYLARMDHER